MTAKDDAAHTEERIFEAAIKVFSLKGKDGARMQEIADLAGINKAMLHYYFRSKEKLYEAVFIYVFQRFSQKHVHCLTEAPTFAETLRAFIHTFIETHHKEPEVIRLMVNENLSGGTTMGRIVSGFKDTDSPPDMLLKKIKEAIERGEIRNVDPTHTLLTILSCTMFFFIWAPTIKLKFQKSENWEQFIQERKDHIFEMLYFGLANKPIDPQSFPAS